MLEAPKVFDSTIVKLMKYYKDKDEWFFLDVCGKIYDDKFVENKDAPEGYVTGRVSGLTTSSHTPPPSTYVFSQLWRHTWNCVDWILTTAQIRKERLIARFDVEAVEARVKED